MIWKQDITDLPPQKPFPLEPICMFVDGKKMTSDTGLHIRYAAGLQVAQLFFHETLHMFTNAFDEVALPHVHCTLNEEMPQLFQIWACKQVIGISATNKNLSWPHWDGCSNKCHAVQLMWRQWSTSCCVRWLSGWRHVCSHLEHWNNGWRRQTQTRI
jgi:hypothetical protein